MMMKHLRVALLLIPIAIVFSGSDHAYGQQGQRLTLIAEMGGAVTDAIPLPDGTILATEGSALIRVSAGFGPPEVIARAELEHGAVLDLASSPPYILALTEDGLVSLPEAAERIPPVIDFAPGGGQSMAVSGSLIVIAAHDAGIWILRLRADGGIDTVSQLELPMPALDGTLSPDGKRAYVATGAGGVQMVDLADPSQPVSLGILADITPAEAVTMLGSLVAVGSEGHVYAVDPDPAAGVVGVYAPIREARRVVVQDDYAYIADAAEGLKILWLAAPDRAVQIYGEIGSPATDLALFGNILYVAGKSGLRILDVSSKYQPLELGRTTLAGTAAGLALDGEGAFPERAFLALGDSGVAIVDVRNLSVPILTGQVVLPGAALAADYANGALYVGLDAQGADTESGIAIIDASTPGAETIAGTMALPGRPLGLTHRGDTLYVAAGDAGVLALDILRPLTPRLLTILPLEPISAQPGTLLREALSIAISGKRAYVADGDGFVVLDISRADRIGRLTRINTPAQHVGLNGVYLYAVGGAQMAIFDARATAEPVYLNTYRGLSQIAHIDTYQSSIFATSTGTGPDAVVVSMAAPDAPVETGSTGAWGETIRLSPANGDVWLAAGFGGLRRYSLSEGGALVPRGSYTPAGEAGVLTTDGTTLLAGGRNGWWALDLAGDLAGVGGVALWPDVRGLAVDSTGAAAVNGSELALYELTGTEGPTLIATSTASGSTAVALDTAYVYVAGAGGLSIFDRRYLLPVAQVATPAPAVDVVLSAGLVYLALEDSRIVVVDPGDPTGGIVLRRAISTRRRTTLISGPDGRVYGLADDLLSRLYINDLSRMGIAEDGTMPVFASDGFFVDSTLAIFLPGEAVRFYDVRLLEEISWHGAVDLSESEYPVEAVAVSGQVVYAAYGDGGLGMVFRAAPAAPVILDQTFTRDVLLIEEALFAAGQSISAWDVTDPQVPKLLATLPLNAPARQIDRAPNGDLLISTESGISVVSWNGTTLAPVGELHTAPVDHAAQIGQHIFAALHAGGLLIADAADPAHPQPLFTYSSQSGQFVNSLLPLGESNLLVSWEGGIDALDVNQLSAGPHVVQMIDASGLSARDLVINDTQTGAAVALGEEGVVLYHLNDAAQPQEYALVNTPGEARGAALVDSTLFVADGSCGLRVYDAQNPDDIEPAGVWRGRFAGSVQISGDVIYVGGGNDLFALQYDATAPAAPPPMPQSPQPAEGSSEVPFQVTLHWGPISDACDPIEYDVYFGMENDPPFLGHVTGNPLLEIGELDPQRTYYWRVESIDAQGSRVRGPLWRFTTVGGIYPENLPPAPPVFLEALRRSPLVPIGMTIIFLILAAIGLITWRARFSQIQRDIPEWYNTGDSDDSA